MQNVATRRRDRINSDEEERLRRGYEIRTGFRFAEPGGRPSVRTASVHATATGKWRRSNMVRPRELCGGSTSAGGVGPSRTSLDLCSTWSAATGRAMLKLPETAPTTAIR